MSLINRLRSGDDRAFEEVVRAHSGRLMSVARRFMRNDEDARDVLQEAFISMHRAIHTFESGARLSTWLHRITVNCALMKIRSRKCRPEIAIDDLMPRFSEDGHHVDPPCPWTEDTDVAMAREQTRVMVRAAIDRLPENYRSVLLLRDIEELDTEETAQVLGISANAVKVRLHRAHQALRTMIDTHFKDTRR
jgi:RNA polymerase sigma-70 factor (ECF subfamily)